jgi:hypothetical protein
VIGFVAKVVSSKLLSELCMKKKEYSVKEGRSTSLWIENKVIIMSGIGIGTRGCCLIVRLFVVERKSKKKKMKKKKEKRKKRKQK